VDTKRGRISYFFLFFVAFDHFDSLRRGESSRLLAKAYHFLSARDQASPTVFIVSL